MKAKELFQPLLAEISHIISARYTKHFSLTMSFQTRYDFSYEDITPSPPNLKLLRSPSKVQFLNHYSESAFISVPSVSPKIAK